MNKQVVISLTESENLTVIDELYADIDDALTAIDTISMQIKQYNDGEGPNRPDDWLSRATFSLESKNRLHKSLIDQLAAITGSRQLLHQKNELTVQVERLTKQCNHQILLNAQDAAAALNKVKKARQSVENMNAHVKHVEQRTSAQIKAMQQYIIDNFPEALQGMRLAKDTAAQEFEANNLKKNRVNEAPDMEA
jgi:hypothetical protein